MNYILELGKDCFNTVYSFSLEYGITYFALAIFSFLFFRVFLKRTFSRFRIQVKEKVTAKSISFDIVHSCLSIVVSGLVVWILDILVINQRHGLFYDNFYDDISEYGWFYAIFTIVFMLVLDDTLFYWIHRFLHLPKIYRYAHKVHHRSIDTTPFTYYSLHPFEAAIIFLGRILVVSLIPVHVFAANTWVFLTLLNGIVAHLGYEIFPHWFTQSRWTNWKASNTYHDMHHQKVNGNYSMTFTWWDKFMGTEFPQYRSALDAVQKRKKGRAAHFTD